MHFELKVHWDDGVTKVVDITDDCMKACEWLDNFELTPEHYRAAIVRVYRSGDYEEYRARRYSS